MGHILLNSVKRFGSLENYIYLCANKAYKAYSMKETDKFVNLSGVELKLGDKVGVYYAQEYRIGVVSGFTKKSVIVDFDFGFMSEQIDHVRLNHGKLAKIYNQDCNVKETWKNIRSIQG